MLGSHAPSERRLALAARLLEAALASPRGHSHSSASGPCRATRLPCVPGESARAHVDPSAADIAPVSALCNVTRRLGQSHLFASLGDNLWLVADGAEERRSVNAGSEERCVPPTELPEELDASVVPADVDSSDRVAASALSMALSSALSKVAAAFSKNHSSSPAAVAAFLTEWRAERAVVPLWSFTGFCGPSHEWISLASSRSDEDDVVPPFTSTLTDLRTLPGGCLLGAGGTMLALHGFPSADTEKKKN
mmetsp:Transcript_159091/g.296395  ORF Transcript_159091/g.296395 Transcript_159091/m.296395 type:complete len:250 (-) Transcript_159091:7-756(-)